MLTIFFVAFLACRDADCRRVEVQVPAPSVAACSRAAMLAAIEWIREHEGFEIRGPITCSAAAVLYYARKPGDDPRMWTLAVRQRDQTVLHRDVLPILRALPGGRA